MIDPWHWTVNGLRGLVGMMDQLEAEKLPASAESLKILEEFLARLGGHLARQQQKRPAQAHGEDSCR